jgi:dihydroorotase
MTEAPFGIVGLETAFPLLYSHFVQSGKMSLKQLLDYLTLKPCEAFNLPYGKIEVGSLADIAVIDLEKEEVIDRSKFLSKGKNTPFDGWNCKGWNVLTIVNGKIVWEKERVEQ